jgi:hypothetical protein
VPAMERAIILPTAGRAGEGDLVDAGMVDDGLPGRTRRR